MNNDASPATRLHLLSELPPMTTGIIRQIAAGNGFSARLAALGLTPGAKVEIIQNFGRGPMIVSVRGVRLALGRGEAIKIQAEVLQPKLL